MHLNNKVDLDSENLGIPVSVILRFHFMKISYAKNGWGYQAH